MRVMASKLRLYESSFHELHLMRQSAYFWVQNAMRKGERYICFY